MPHLSQRAALFGLDARIALAIMGGLSVVTGAILFGVLGDIRASRAVGEIETIAEAYKAFVADTGRHPSRMEDLISSNLPRWNGPYLPYTDTQPATNNLMGNAGRFFSLLSHTDAAGTQASMTGCGTPCWAWVSISPFTLAEAQAIDQAIDGTDSDTLGLSRYEPGDDPSITIIYKIAPRP